METDPVPEDAAAVLGALPRRVIGVAASAGGVEALRRLFSQLPADLDAAFCVVLHIPPTGRSLLAPILARYSALNVTLAEHGAPLRAGTVYVAPADHHLLVRADAVELSRGSKENGVRPAADPMFRSLARAWGDCAGAVILSGALDDGAAGAAAIAAGGGRVIVQDPTEALVPGMPSSAIAVTTPDAVVGIEEMGDTLRRLLAAPVPGPGREGSVPIDELAPRPAGPASGFTCPECNGAIWELREGDLLRGDGSGWVLPLAPPGPITGATRERRDDLRSRLAHAMSIAREQRLRQVGLTAWSEAQMTLSRHRRPARRD